MPQASSAATVHPPSAAHDHANARGLGIRACPDTRIPRITAHSADQCAFCPWHRAVLDRIGRERENPAVAGYSATPQSRKLGLEDGTRLAVVGAPDGWELDGPPDVVEADGQGGDPADVILAFARDLATIDGGLDGWARRIAPAGTVWVLWPRKAAGHRSEVDENAIREAALSRGLVDVKVAAVDTDWSGLKLVWRKENR